MELLFAFTSTSTAIAAEAALLDAGLPVQVMNLPSAIQAGCGICLRLPVALGGQGQAALRTVALTEYALYLRQVQNGQSHYTPYTEET